MPTDPDNARLADELEQDASFAESDDYPVMASRIRRAATIIRSQQVRAVPGGLDKDKLAECPINGSFANGSLADYYGTIVAALSIQPDDVKAMIERLRRTTRVMVGNPGEVDYDGPVFEDRPVNPDGPEAAAMLETLHTEIGRAVEKERELFHRQIASAVAKLTVDDDEPCKAQCDFAIGVLWALGEAMHTRAIVGEGE